jgi:hypothetical protein
MTELLDFWFKLLTSRNIAIKIRRVAWLILEVERNRFYSTEMCVGNNVAAFSKRMMRRRGGGEGGGGEGGGGKLRTLHSS